MYDGQCTMGNRQQTVSNGLRAGEAEMRRSGLTGRPGVCDRMLGRKVRRPDIHEGRDNSDLGGFEINRSLELGECPVAEAAGEKSWGV